jgi:ribonuclease Z
MKCILLGSGGHLPLPERFLTSVAVRVGRDVYLFDAGECTQLAMRKANLTAGRLKVLAVSHMHGDHCLGIPGLLMLRNQDPDPAPLTIVGPPGIRKYVAETLYSMNHTPKFEILYHEWDEKSETAWQDETVQIRWLPLNHRIFCLGYRLEEHPRPGKFNTAAAEKLGIPPGPYRADLQRGKTVTLEDGTTVAPSQVLGPARPGKIFAFTTDTSRCKNLYPLLNQADIAFIEGTFHPDETMEADRSGHMTISEACRIAGRAGVKRTVIVHLSPRYRSETDLERLHRTVIEAGINAEIGVDSAVYNVTETV